MRGRDTPALRLPPRSTWLPLLARALREDLGEAGDLTTQALVPAGSQARAHIVARQGGVVAGLAIAAECFESVARDLKNVSRGPRSLTQNEVPRSAHTPSRDVAPPVSPDAPEFADWVAKQREWPVPQDANESAAVRYEFLAHDGERVAAGTILLVIEGPAQVLLTAERTALNLLGRLCAVATLTRSFVEAIGSAVSNAAPAGSRDAVDSQRPLVVDTRKTTPGLRALEKYAVRCGGGHNHRFGLSDGVLIKDNHLVLAGSVGEALRRARAAVPHGLRVEVEVDSLEQLEEALAAGAELVLLDNMEPDQLRRAVVLCRAQSRPVLTEASGGVTLETAAEIAATGVDYISVGALTHSAGCLDVALDFVGSPSGE